MPPAYGTEKFLRQRSELKALRAYFKALPRPRETNEKTHTIEWSPDGRYLAASQQVDKAVSLYTLAGDRGKLVKEHTFRGHHEPVDQVCWHKSCSDLLASASCDKSVRIWDARAQKCQACVQTKGENINITWSPDGNTIAVGNKNDLISFIDVRKFEVFREEQYSVEVNELSWNADNSRFFVTTGCGYFQVLSWPDLSVLQVIQANPVNCITVRFSPDGKKFGVGAADGLVSIWDSAELLCLRTLSRLEWPVRTVSFSHDNLLIASGSEDLVIHIAHVETGEKVSEIQVNMPCFTVAWHPKRYLLAYSCDEKYGGRTQKDVGTLRIYGLS